MIGLGAGALKIYVALDPCDMRKSFNGLSELAARHHGSNPGRDSLFVFTNKSKNRIKLLYFDGTGTWVAAKRLEKGRFSWPAPSSAGQRRIKLQTEALQLLLDGVDLRGASLKPWYERPG
ncbi:MAG: IS66 family insertion sequence element accessory protein TnpB [Verrucomicrobiae bacterium]|nr:IS66 family insertion sequence element accessory protein TnpB [Verrucomicrobiae bacterium]